MSADPFLVLGLPADPALTDDDVRAAWRRLAAATHPDRADGGDPAAFAAAAAAYSDLRTAFGRGEALASLPAGRRAGPGRPPAAWRLVRGRPRAVRVGRISGGRPGRLALRLAVVALAGILVVAADGWRPATPALLTGLVIWLIRSGRRDLAAGRDRPRGGRASSSGLRPATCAYSRASVPALAVACRAWQRGPASSEVQGHPALAAAGLDQLDGRGELAEGEHRAGRPQLPGGQQPPQLGPALAD